MTLRWYVSSMLGCSQVGVPAGGANFFDAPCLLQGASKSLDASQCACDTQRSFGPKQLLPRTLSPKPPAKPVARVWGGPACVVGGSVGTDGEEGGGRVAGWVAGDGMEW